MMEQTSQPSDTQSTSLRVVVEVGVESFEPGMTRVEVQANGRALVMNRLEGRENQVEASVEQERISRVMDQVVAETRRQSETPARLGLPDEPRYHIALYRDAELVSEAHVWRSQLANNPGIASLVNTLQSMTLEASDGKIIL